MPRNCFICYPFINIFAITTKNIDQKTDLYESETQVLPIFDDFKNLRHPTDIAYALSVVSYFYISTFFITALRLSLYDQL